MNREKELTKNTLIISIGNICTKLVVFLLLPLYTTLLSTDEYGVVDLVNTLVSLALPIVTFQIEKAVFRELIEVRGNKEKSSSIVSTGIIATCLQCVLYTIIFIVLSPLIRNDYKYFLISNVIVFIFLSLFQQISRGFGYNKKFAASSFISATFTIILNIVFIVILRLGAYGMLLGTALGELIATIYLFFSLKLYSYVSIKSFYKEIAIKLLKYSIPLVPNALSWWIFGSSDSVIVSLILGIDSNGILAASLKFSTIIITLYNMFDAGWIESVSLHVKDNDISDYYNRVFNTILQLFISIAIAMISFMPFIFNILINEKFNSGYNLVPITLISAIFHIIVGLVSVIYAAEKNTKSIAVTSGVAAIINILVHLALIKFIGLYAAVISSLVAFIIMSIYRVYDVGKKYFKITISKKLIISTLIMLIIVLPIYYINNKYLNIISIIISSLSFFIQNRILITKGLCLVKERFNKKKRRI